MNYLYKNKDGGFYMNRYFDFNFLISNKCYFYDINKA